MTMPIRSIWNASDNQKMRQPSKVKTWTRNEIAHHYGAGAVSLKPTFKQVELLRRFNVSLAHIDTATLASEVIALIRDNGWRRPSEEELAQLIVGEVPNDDFGDY